MLGKICHSGEMGRELDENVDNFVVSFFGSFCLYAEVFLLVIPFLLLFFFFFPKSKSMGY